MRIARLLLLFTLTVLLTVSLVSCMTYTYADAQKEIPPLPPVPPQQLAETRLAAIERDGKPLSPPVEVATIPVRLPLTILQVALVPLPCEADEQFLDRILSESTQRNYDVLGFTGDQRSIAYVKEHARSPSITFGEDRVLLTDLEILEVDRTRATLAVGEYGILSVGMVNLQDSVVFQELRATEDRHAWERVIAQAHPERLSQVNELLQIREEATLILASLGEPSAEDWFETAGDHPYRMALNWPLGEAFEEAGFLDSWRMTRYNAVTDPGWTWEFTDVGEHYTERVDFLFSRKLIPIESNTEVIGPWDTKRFPHEQRSAVTGTFILP